MTRSAACGGRGMAFIGVTAATSEDGAACSVRISYLRALTAAGAAPILLPNLDEAELRAAWLDRLDGVLLTGGADVDPALYGEEVLNGTVKTDGVRDRAELPLIRDAWARRMPILAICRGIQALNVALGGSLYQDLPSQKPSAIAHRQAQERCVCSHAIRIRTDSRLAQLSGTSTLQVNSFHHQAIRRLAPGLQAVAWAEDGVIEGVEAPASPFVVGVQYHPEDLADTQREARSLFEGFVAAAKAWRTQTPM
ncbi:MAG: gamma-glutamyl-gamma-aminobutyrate hydrolase family protein [Chthonomonadales bacterium]